MTPKLDVLQGKKPISWERLMALKAVGHDEFESLTAAWPPAPHTRTFGGHVYAQAIWACAQTVGDGLVVHQVTGHFILPGTVDTPFVYRVRRIRDGGIYCLRGVDVFQESEAAGGGKTPCFVATVSFKRAERAAGRWIDFTHQSVPRHHIHTTYRSVLGGKRPEDHPLAPGADAVWWEEEEMAAWSRAAAAFPGVETRKVDMSPYNGTVEEGAGGGDGDGPTTRWRQLLFYRIILDDKKKDSSIPLSSSSMSSSSRHRPTSSSSAPPSSSTLNLHAAAHLYASDRNSLFLIQHAAGFHKLRTNMASLSHTVIFHQLADAVSMVDEHGRPRWFVQESWTTFSADKRGTHNSYLWDYERGLVLATTIQDGMMRFPDLDHGPDVGGGGDDDGKSKL